MAVGFLLTIKALGLSLEFNIIFQHPINSFTSAGLKTFRFGIDLKVANFSTGGYIGHSPFAVNVSCVNIYVTGKFIKADCLICGFT